MPTKPTMQEEMPVSELDRLMSDRHWCEREGECRVHRVGQTVTADRFACSVCLVLWACRLTALGPAWWKVGSVAPSTDTVQ